VPVVLWSRHCRPDAVRSFGETAAAGGALGPMIPATSLVPLAVANALRLEKFGA
jgi:2,3-bisphosphoglycerate-independent phosphoglycerate mutase